MARRTPLARHLLAVVLAAAYMLVASRLGAVSPLVINMQDFGAVPGTDTASQTATYNAIVKALATPEVPGTGQMLKLYFPADRLPYTLPRPIVLDRNWVEFAGDGPGTVLQMRPGRSDPVFIFGLPRDPLGKRLTPDHLVDAFGLLDVAACPTPGRLFALRLRNDSHLFQSHGPFALGPAARSGPNGYWADVRQFVLEFGQDTTETRPPGAPIGGVDGTFWFADGPTHSLVLYTNDASGSPLSTNQFSMAVPWAPGKHRIAWQVDLDARRVTGYADNVQVAVSSTWRAPNPPAGTTTHLAANFSRSYTLGALHSQAVISGSTASTISQVTYDRLIFGHALCLGLKYANDGAGLPQRRLDNRPNTDVLRYRNGDGTAWAWLSLTDQPAAVGERLVDGQAASFGYTRSASLYWASNEHASNYSSRQGYVVRGMQLKAGNAPYGDAIALGAALDVQVYDASLLGGARGFACWNGLANYTHTLRRVTLGGDLCGLFGWFSIIDAEDIRFPVTPRNAIWVEMCRAAFRRVIIPDFGAPDRIIMNRYGACLVDDLAVDIEGGQYPAVALAEMVIGPGTGTNIDILRLRDVGTGGFKAGVPLVLVNKVGGPTIGRVDIANWDGYGGSGARPAFLLQNTDDVQGTIDLDFLTPFPLVATTTGRPSKVRVIGPMAP